MTQNFNNTIYKVLFQIIIWDFSMHLQFKTADGSFLFLSRLSASYRRLRRPCLQYVDKTDKSRWTHCRTCSNASRSCVSAFTTPSVRFSSTGSSSPAGKSTSYWTTGPDAAPPEVLEELWQSSLLSLDLLLSLLCHGHHLTDCTSSSSLQQCRLDVRFRVWTQETFLQWVFQKKKVPSEVTQGLATVSLKS